MIDTITTTNPMSTATNPVSTCRSGLPRVLMAVLAVAALALAAAGPAAAAVPAPGWTLDSVATPTNFSPADSARCLATLSGDVTCDAYQLEATNAGSQPSDGSTVTVSDTLPAGLTVQRVQFSWSGIERFGVNPLTDLNGRFGIECTTAGQQVTCPLSLGLPVEPDDTLRMVISVTADDPPTPGPLTTTATVAGGGAPEVRTVSHNTVALAPPPFGVAGFSSYGIGADGLPDTQAGGHPYEQATRIDLNTMLRVPPEGGIRPGTERDTVEDLKDVAIELPLGFLGSAQATPTCSFAQFSSRVNNGESGCPTDTILGRLRTIPEAEDGVNGPLYNLAPEYGVPAEFGFIDNVDGAHTLNASVVPGPGGYHLGVIVRDIPQVTLTGIVATFYGNPSAKSGGAITPLAMFTNPSTCDGENLVATIRLDSWQHPGSFNADGTPNLSDPNWASGTSTAPPLAGCNQLQFQASMGLQPDTTVADSPSGVHVDVTVPQSAEPNTLATPPLKDASVTLPPGFTVNPSSAGGLQSCSLAQIGLTSASPPSCPEASQIGTVSLTTPLLPGTLTGSIYLASQFDNPFHSLLAAYVVVDDPTTGLVIKIPGNLTPDPNTGQITGVFDSSPQFPFSDLKLDFKGGPRGVLATPQSCGTYTTTSDLMPWSAPDSGPDATPFSGFPIDTGCVGGFAPAFTAGTVNPQAGGYSPFTLSLSRTDGDQNLAGLSVTLPPGLLGKIAGVPLCPDAQANAGTCPDASRVGTVQAGAGVGPDPFFIGGKAYLTGPYNGGPYGLVVQVPAVAGPFNLGMVSVRQSLRIDPHTAQVTDVSDPFPTILDGIPLRIRRVDVTLDRPGFTFNPTNCNPMAIAGTLTSTEGASASVSSRFQVGGCSELGFKPTFKVSTQANTSKKNGASLDVKVVYPQGAQANIRSVGVTLPKVLPSRLSTIQQACPQATFNQNPASCPAGSDIGTATAYTPVLAGPVSGPAYLVSHGGAAFPDLVLILQGEGIKLELIGSINIKHGVTSSAFNSVPDAPISSFELKLPEGSHSALAAVLPAKVKGNLCGTSLTMPTTLTGQNDATLKQNTKIQVTGCKATRRTHGKKKPKAKKHHKAKKK